VIEDEQVDLDIALLRAFVVTADEQHFGRAAERLVISQQALSKRIQRLEQLLGVSLFDRTNRSVAITATGSRLLPHARRAVDTADAVVTEAAKGTGPLRIDVLDEHLTPMLIARQVALRDPSLVIEARTRADRQDAIAALRTSDVDVAIGRAGAVPEPWPVDIRRRVLLLEPLRLLVGADHAFADRDAVPLAELRNIRLWFPMVGAPAEWIDYVDELCRDFDLVVDSAGSTLGFDFFLRRAQKDAELATFFGAAMQAPPGSLRVVSIVEPTPVFGWWAMWRRRVPDWRVDELAELAAPMADVTVAEARDPAKVWMPASDRARL
jgi:DNA-binding transcriptional LysR family regulator